VVKHVAVLAAAAAVAAGIASSATDLLTAAAPPPSRPLIIAHRGASGHRPEHTLEAYRLAVEMGADFVEPDLVSTKDGVLIARHENQLGDTTDVAARFPDRQRTKTIDGRSVTGWFSEDFTLKEIKTLRARERLPFRSHAYDGKFEVPTFDEVIALAQTLGKAAGRTIGVYPETKHPTYFRSIQLPLEEPLLASLEKHGWNRRDAPVFIQSFEPGNLRELRRKTQVRLVQLVSSSALLQGDAIKKVSEYADGLGPEKRLIVPVKPDGSLDSPTDVIARAHAAGLVVHVWTLRVEKEFLPAGYKGRPDMEFEQFRELGVDGVFTDFPDIAFKAYASR
jgi:glycerophosphoryl diester phosphodiesterase